MWSKHEQQPEPKGDGGETGAHTGSEGWLGNREKSTGGQALAPHAGPCRR